MIQYNKKNLSKLFLILGIILTISPITFLENKYKNYSNNLGDIVFPENNNYGLSLIAIYLLASTLFYCSYKLISESND